MNSGEADSLSRNGAPRVGHLSCGSTCCAKDEFDSCSVESGLRAAPYLSFLHHAADSALPTYERRACCCKNPYLQSDKGSRTGTGGEKTEVQTVRGKISVSDMGITLPHEHIFLDMRSMWSKPSREDKADLVDARVSLGIMGRLLHDMAVCKDNLVLDDPETAAKELSMFKVFGGKTVVDVTTRGISPNPVGLCNISNKVGLNIIAGTGYYVARTHPADMTKRTVDELAEEMIRDIQVGFEGTGVKAGIIGELGTSHPLVENEKKVLCAAAWAQKSTGVTISVHLPWRGKHALKVIHILESKGVDPGKTIISHMDDMEDMSFEYHKAVAELGAYLGFDCFGSEDYVEADNFVHPRDTERIAALKRLIDLGYIDNLLLSQDVCLKTLTRTYGGYGYEHILRTIVPMLKRVGLTDAEINHMTVQNPARAIAY